MKQDGAYRKDVSESVYIIRHDTIRRDSHNVLPCHQLGLFMLVTPHTYKQFSVGNTQKCRASRLG